MKLFEIIILAIIQGLTEFLPISSSGHLSLFQNIFEKIKGTSSENATLDILLHFGTFIATALFFRKEIVQLIKGLFSKKPQDHSLFQGHERKIVLVIAIAMIPTVLMGLLLEPYFEVMIDNTLLVGIMLFITALILFTAKFSSPRKNAWEIGLFIALAVGLAQGLAIIPGLSRSGLTIVTALLLGMDRESAFRFSFLISLPAIFGATLLNVKELNFYDVNLMGGYIIGMTVTAVIGYVSLIVLGKMVLTKKIHLFSYYCLAIGALGIFLYLYGF
jgi:undecaprenyl-diphosphatase